MLLRSSRCLGCGCAFVRAVGEAQRLATSRYPFAGCVGSAARGCADGAVWGHRSENGFCDFIVSVRGHSAGHGVNDFVVGAGTKPCLVRKSFASDGKFIKNGNGHFIKDGHANGRFIKDIRKNCSPRLGSRS